MYVDGFTLFLLIVAVVALWDRDKRATIAIQIHHNQIEELRSDVRMLERDVADLEKELGSGRNSEN